MAKCPKCSSRKGKRYCPALAAEICSACCGEFRQREIACPADCAYLGAEDYQRGRRRERSQSQGKALIKALSRHFADGKEKEFVSALLTEIYAYSRRAAPGTKDDDVATALDQLHGLLGKILVASGTPSPLATFLQTRCDRLPALGTSRLFSGDARSRALRALEAFVRETTDRHEHDGASPNFMDLLRGLFDPLDLEQDLGYVWEISDEEAGAPQSTFERRSSGLIVPPSMS